MQATDLEPLITTSELSQEVLGRLTTGACLAVRVQNYCDAQLAQELAAWFIHSGRVERYDHEIALADGGAAYAYYGVDRVGFPFNQVLGAHGELHLGRYRSEALQAIRKVRSVCAPRLSPIDRLRLELDELWPDGCQVANFIGSKMFVGIARIMKAETSQGSEDTPHYDGIPTSVYPFDQQLAANVYLHVPSEGGELVIWDVPGRGGLTRADLPEPAAVIRPAVGDLILFRAQRMHAISRFAHGVRVSLHSFIGHKQGESLQLWD